MAVIQCNWCGAPFNAALSDYRENRILCKIASTDVIASIHSELMTLQYLMYINSKTATVQMVSLGVRKVFFFKSRSVTH